MENEKLLFGNAVFSIASNVLRVGMPPTSRKHYFCYQKVKCHNIFPRYPLARRDIKISARRTWWSRQIEGTC